MHKFQASDDGDHGRRHFFRTAVATIAAAQLGVIGEVAGS